MKISFSRPAYTENGNLYNKTKLGTAIAVGCAGYSTGALISEGIYNPKTKEFAKKGFEYLKKGFEFVAQKVKTFKFPQFNKEALKTLKSKVNKENAETFIKKLKPANPLFKEIAIMTSVAALALGVQKAINVVRSHKADKNA